MVEKLDIDEGALDSAIDRAIEQGAKYADIRVETAVSESASAENGDIKNVSVEDGTTVGVRALAGGTWGFYSIDISDGNEIKDAIYSCVERAVKAAKAVAGFEEVKLAPVEPVATRIPQKMKKPPIPLDEKKRYVIELSKTMKAVDSIAMAYAGLNHIDETKYFWSTDGAKIVQDRMLIAGVDYALGASEGKSQVYYIPYGAVGGWEFIERLNPEEMAIEIADMARRLATEAVVPESRLTTVVARPDFNSLLVHEIVGHPVEADRVLGGESAWAGRAWWKEMVGQRIGSELVTAVSDARPIDRHLGFYGTFHYDDEGVPAKRVVHLDKGILTGFLQSRQTAAIYGTEPSGAMRAVDASVMPIIRMTNTYFEPLSDGPSSLEEMIEDIDDGVIMGHQSIPSIGSRRYRWQINAFNGWEIKNGEVGRLLKNVAVIGNTPGYLGSVFRVGNENTFQLKQIPNCGKGDPMQVMRLSNGGPLMASKIRVVGGA